MRTLTLPEYSCLQGVALDPEDFAALAPFAPNQLAISRSLDGAGYDLTATSWVGAIRTPQLDLVIEPKVPVSRLLFLLSYTLDPKRWREVPYDYESAPSLVEAVIPGFAHQVRRAIRRGLLQGYRVREDSLTTVRGRIDLDRQVRRRFGRAPPVEVSYDEFTEDITENRLLKAAIDRLGSIRLHSPASRGLLRPLASAFERVALLDFDPRGIPEVFYNRLNEHYRPAVELARLILRATTFDVAHGKVRSSAFLVDMNAIFEAFVTVALREALGADEGSFPVQDKAPNLHLDDDRRVRLKPDLTWLPAGSRVFVGDVKYKSLGASGHVNPDLYQVLAYAVAAGLPGAVLIYAAGEAEDAAYRVSSAGKQLHVWTVDISAPPPAILDRIRRIAEHARPLAAPPGSPQDSEGRTRGVDEMRAAVKA